MKLVTPVTRHGYNISESLQQKIQNCEVNIILTAIYQVRMFTVSYNNQIQVIFKISNRHDRKLYQYYQRLLTNDGFFIKIPLFVYKPSFSIEYITTTLKHPWRTLICCICSWTRHTGIVIGSDVESLIMMYFKYNYIIENSKQDLITTSKTVNL